MFSTDAICRQLSNQLRRIRSGENDVFFGDAPELLTEACQHWGTSSDRAIDFYVRARLAAEKAGQLERSLALASNETFVDLAWEHARACATAALLAMEITDAIKRGVDRVHTRISLVRRKPTLS